MKLINTGPEPFFEDVANHMAAICGVPIAAIALLDGNRHWINQPDAECGRECPNRALDVLSWVGREAAAVANFMPPPQLLDTCERVPRSYVSTPLMLAGEYVGALLIADTKPRDWSRFEIDYMTRSARLVAGHFEARAALAQRDRRVELEARLQEADALHRAILSSMHEGLLVHSIDGRVLACNAAAERVLGRSTQDLINRCSASYPHRLVNEDGQPITYDVLPPVQAVRSGAMRSATLGFPLESGERRWMELTSTPMAMSPGRPGAVVTTFHDVTDQKRQEQELRDALKAAEAASIAKSAFLANMSHEIRTPLNGVLGMAQALRNETLTPSQAEKVELMVESGITLMTVLNDILDISKVEAGKVAISPIDVDMHTGLRQVVEVYRAKADEKGLVLDLFLDIDLPERLCIDPVRTRQCLTNLISNAVKFTAQGGVTISASTQAGANGQLLRLVVRDTGIGMNDEQAGRLFTDFSQADESTTRRFGGTGLGLSISRKLARLMGGDIVVESTPGQGSTFTLTVRADAAAAAEPAQPDQVRAEPAVSGLRGKRILLADDNPINRRVAQMLMRPFGIEITEAENGAQALERLAAETFDLVLMDVHMPVMDGNEAVARIRASDQPWSRVPVIALTADAMQGDRERLLANGMDGYLAKPIDQRELFTAINAALFGRAASRAAA